jgi:glycogen synthase
VREKARALFEKYKALPEDVSRYVFVGKYNHQQSLDNMLGFLEFLIINSYHKVTLGTSNIDRLWQMFV